MGAVSAEVLGERAEALRVAYGGYNGLELLRVMVEDVFPGRIAVTSSFGAEGYASIGCTTCTRRIAEGEGIRDGRWPGTAKTECGIHLPQPVNGVG